MKYAYILPLAVALSCTSNVEVETAVVDPLPSWAEGEVKSILLQFVEETTSPGGPHFIAEPKRIACFDNDGTLWAEQPYYFQLAFVAYQVKKLAPQHPEWKEQMPFKAILEDDMAAALHAGTLALLELVNATHAGISTTAFEQAVEQWLEDDRHPTTGKPFTAMVYQPMLELMDFLRAKGYTVFIVSGGGLDFMRVWADEVYGIHAWQTVGSSSAVRYTHADGKPVLMKEAGGLFIDDKENKPVGIYRHIGAEPVLAVGNSDGDYAMLEYTTSLPGKRLGVLLHHTDSVREWAYDHPSAIGHLKMGLDSAGRFGWQVVDMAKDWKTVWPE